MFKQFPLFLSILGLWMLVGCASQKQATTRQPSPSSISRPSTQLPKEPKRAIRRLNELDTRQQKIINTARSFTGTPYRWGGTTRGGMDCSGLLMISFQEGGVNIPRTSAEQSKIGRLISIYDLRPGDLVFFATKSKRSRQVTHAGLVTEIRGKKNVQFIHASTKLGVVESNIFSDYYRRAFVKARRPF